MKFWYRRFEIFDLVPKFEHHMYRVYIVCTNLMSNLNCPNVSIFGVHKTYHSVGRRQAPFLDTIIFRPKVANIFSWNLIIKQNNDVVVE